MLNSLLSAFVLKNYHGSSSAKKHAPQTNINSLVEKAITSRERPRTKSRRPRENTLHCVPKTENIQMHRLPQTNTKHAQPFIFPYWVSSRGYAFRGHRTNTPKRVEYTFKHRENSVQYCVPNKTYHDKQTKTKHTPNILPSTTNPGHESGIA